MPKHSVSVDSFDEFFSVAKSQNDVDKQNDIPTSSGVAALIRSQPLIHTRQTPSETKPIGNSKQASMTTNGKNVPTKFKPNDSPHSKVYESDLDDEINTDGRKKHKSLPPSKQRSYVAPRRGSDSEVRASDTITSDGTPRKEKFLPYIRPKNRRNDFKKPSPVKKTRSEAEQRLSSAQNEKVNELRSRISDVRRQLEQERFENHTLRIVQKREEKSLKSHEDQEYSAQKVAQDFRHEIEYVKEKITYEKEAKVNLEKEVQDQDETLRSQTKRMKFYEKLVTHEQDYEEYDELRERFKETDKRLKAFQEKITKQQKYIENLEHTYRQEIAQELVKRRDLKHEVDEQSKKYNDLFLKYEHRARQVDTMHIYLQRGGRRPSGLSVDLEKAMSFQYVKDTSPQFRDKMLDYDKKRREQDKDKPKPPPLPIKSPPRPERKKYIPSINLKPKPKPKPTPQITKISPEPVHVIHEEKPPVIQQEPLPPAKSPVRRLSSPKSFDDYNSDLEDDIIIEPAYEKPRSPSPSIRISVSPPVQNTPPPSLFKLTEPPPPAEKPTVTRDFDDKWLNIFAADKKEDLPSKLASGEPQEKKSTSSSSRRPSMTMFELSTNQKRMPPRVVTSVYDFEQAVINLHDGKPVTAQPTTNKTSVDPFESSSGKITNKPISRDESFTKIQFKANSFESHLAQPTSEAITSTTKKANSKQTPPENGKLQKPKVVTNAPRSIPNRTGVEEIEEFVL